MRNRPRVEPPPSFAALVQRFFTQYLMEQRALSPCTIAAYRVLAGLKKRVILMVGRVLITRI